MTFPGIDTNYIHSSPLLDSAKALAELSSQNSLLAVPTAIIAISAFESYLSEIVNPLTNSGTENLRSAGQFLAEAERDHLQLKSKVLYCYHLLTGTALNKGAQPFQDFSLLVDCRNLIAHAKSESITWSGMPVAEGEWISMADGSIAKDEEHKLKEGVTIKRDKKADKIIESLVQRKVISINPKTRMCSWLLVLQNPNFAHWCVGAATAMQDELEKHVRPK